MVREPDGTVMNMGEEFKSSVCAPYEVLLKRK